MSGIASGFIGSVLALLVASGYKDVTATKDSQGNTIFSSGGKKIATLSKSFSAPYSNIFNFTARLTTTSNQIDVRNPNLEIDNPFDAVDCLLMDISTVFDAAFKSHGGFVIKINNQPIVEDTTSNPSTPNTSWVDVANWELDLRPQGQKFGQNDKMKIWITNDDGLTDIALTLSVTFAIIDTG